MDKQTAIDLLDNLLGMVEDNHGSDYDKAIHMGIDALKMQLSIERTTFPVDGEPLDCISRQQTILAIERNAYRHTYVDQIVDIIKWLPSVEELKSEAWDTAYLEGYTAGQNAQPKYVALHESCTDCPLYDRKNYNCPRFNRVIPMAIRDAQTQVKALSLPSVQPERMTNRQWIDFLSAQFDISRTSAKEMLHGMMQWKKEDKLKKMFNGGKT